MAAALSLPVFRGVVLDAGCGEGIDLANLAREEHAEVVGVELSEGGCRTSFRRIARLAGAHVVQADLCRLPFADMTFDAVYSYGVLHHIATPALAAGEAARISRHGACVAVYLYEDFGERSAVWRWLLRSVNSARVVTTKLPPRALFAVCWAASPLVYVLCAVPFTVLKRFRPLRSFAWSLPFRHARGPFRLAGDLYDRFSAPIEYRYSRGGAADLLR
ncbi:MAG: class I SAM-dependent methyltransferase [SAR202 cluster bacterium]|jgi:SAM-dependent methyltransferase|nr:class I SAM-dependent methyltransferase [SAR202 cluster bacterium]MDP6663262.1 class I SAM-dependent methyltransferase [SAR202 cluster bacterium]|tara:strand:- start:19433 stop:20086 length:654 start_codon:yes stop_codon:yes gene_type:complete